jgi:hypothetical protein
MLVVTRHPALVAYLLDIGIIDEHVKVVAHAVAADVAGQTVIGVLPLSLAALATRIIEVPLAVGPDDRGRELTIDDIRRLAQPPRAYRVVAVAVDG